MEKQIDIGSLTIIVVTFLLFIVALFVKGLTKDILLEAGILLVSVKLIMMAYKSRRLTDEIKEELREIKKMVETTCR